jgi:hypothetical protein
VARGIAENCCTCLMSTERRWPPIRVANGLFVDLERVAISSMMHQGEKGHRIGRRIHAIENEEGCLRNPRAIGSEVRIESTHMRIGREERLDMAYQACVGAFGSRLAETLNAVGRGCRQLFLELWRVDDNHGDSKPKRVRIDAFTSSDERTSPRSACAIATARSACCSGVRSTCAAPQSAAL